MAISATHYELLKRLRPLLPQGGSLLEIGEANWYGDVDPTEHIYKLFNPTDCCDDEAARDCSDAIDSGNLFNIAKAFYSWLFRPSRIVSIDMNGTPSAWKCDLNKPLPPLGQFDVVMNHGTAEHIFNIAQVFASIHQSCKVGGLMIHESPFTGWLDHGFYCLQPTLFYDLAAVNGYEVVSVNLEHIATLGIIEVTSREHMTQLLKGGVLDNTMLYVAMRKLRPDAFVIPMQGYYSGTLDTSGKQAWETMR